ncbi:type VI secretion system lipoprotein TssJ [Helicobacter sp. MIT 11-5569]|uniref:type VI secretion system lipoprotein TssJ n=1 Tax=Helicobacter sp. MIT 11-5569 TaxID=1548151 RepID=UPI00051F9F29|nr:type VI secretion system lipoprotein TssJ [Helicobacter sp. MIT 11-5569]TLD80005.1 type VI secretion system lipoprotein TssJ [Helicobacter sp. MIT 11-5569]
MVYKNLLFLLMVLVFSACSSKVDITINNHERSNLNNRQDDVPLTIIVYQLKDIKKFEQASDIDLFAREDGILGKDKIDSMKMQIAPRDNIVAVNVKDKEVPYIGILVFFANNDKKITKAWAKTSDASGIWFGKKKLEFKITQDGINKVQ